MQPELNAAKDGTAPLILVVEDDPEIAGFVMSALSRNGYGVVGARNRTDVLEQFETEIPDLVVLDVMLPGENGFSILGRIRQRFETPVIMLTALAEVNDRVKGLVGGADDYLSKPFHTTELLARIAAVLRRRVREIPETAQPDGFTFDGWRIDRRRRSVKDPAGTEVVFTSAEFDMLWTLTSHAGTTLGRDTLVQKSQNRAIEPYDRRVDTLISRIRRKLGNPDIIKTVRNGGYVFTPQVDESTGA